MFPGSASGMRMEGRCFQVGRKWDDDGGEMFHIRTQLG